MSLPRSFLDEIRARLTLSDIIGRRIRITRAGREFKACCPFHKEKTASFTINDQKGFYHCFGCGAHGDVLSFVMEHDNLPFMEAVEQLAPLAGLQVPKSSPQEVARYEKQKSLYTLLDAAAQWFTAQLTSPNHQNAQRYLRDRGLNAQTLKDFRVGYAPDDATALYKHLQKEGYSAQDMIATGLMRKSNYNQDVFAFFRGRIIFPVMDSRGRVVAFGGRILPDEYAQEIASKNAPKYLNSPDTEVFHKGRLVYGLYDKIRQATANNENVVVVEGYMDVIALAQAGFHAAVAPLGTAVTETQIEEVWRLSPQGQQRTPVLCFDGDAAGQRAAARVLDRVLPILKPDHSVRFAFLPSGEDPDSLVKAQGAGAFRKILDNTASLFDMLWAREVKERDMTTPEARAGVKAALEQSVKEIADKAVQDFYLEEIRKRIFKKTGNKTGSRGYKQKGKWQKQYDPDAHRPQLATLSAPLSAATIRERIMLACVINNPLIYEDIAEYLGMMICADPGLEAVRQEVISLFAQDPDLDTDTLTHHLSVAGFEKNLEDICNKTVYLHAGFAQHDQPVETVIKGWLDTWEYRSKDQKLA